MIQSVMVNLATLNHVANNYDSEGVTTTVSYCMLCINIIVTVFDGIYAELWWTSLTVNKGFWEVNSTN